MGKGYNYNHSHVFSMAEMAVVLLCPVPRDLSSPVLVIPLNINDIVEPRELNSNIFIVTRARHKRRTEALHEDQMNNLTQPHVQGPSGEISHPPSTSIPSLAAACECQTS